MIRHLSLIAFTSLALVLLPTASSAADEPAQPAAAEVNKVCPITGKPADPNITVVYEGKTYAFADEAARAKFNEAREKSLYQRLGGKPAIDAAVEAFYVKILADNRTKHFFDDVNMDRQKRKMKMFLSAAFGGPIPYVGMDLVSAHAGLGITDADFNAVAGNLQSTLEDLKIKKELIAEVMTIAGSVHDSVVGHTKPAAK